MSAKLSRNLSLKVLTGFLGILGASALVSVPVLAESPSLRGPQVRSGGEFHPNRPQISPNAPNAYNDQENRNVNNQTLAPRMDNRSDMNTVDPNFNRQDSMNRMPNSNSPSEPNFLPDRNNPNGTNSR